MSDNEIGNSRVAVLGAGTMGAQIALSFALGGLDVVLWGRGEASLAKARTAISQASQFLVQSGLRTDEDIARAQARLRFTTDLGEAVGSADIAIEAIVEDLAAKKMLLVSAEGLMTESAVLSSTTSTISPSELQRNLRRPGRFVVAHYAQPAHLIKLVEVVAGAKTEPQTVQFVTALLAHTGKTPVTCPDIPGFLWARIQFCILREFSNLVERGLATPEACDAILKEGYAVRLPAMGAFEHADLAGLDLVGGEAAALVWADLCNAGSPDDTIIGAKRRKGELGMKTGQGFYDWKLRDPVEFKRNRDTEIVRRIAIQAGGKVVLEDDARGRSEPLARKQGDA